MNEYGLHFVSHTTILNAQGQFYFWNGGGGENDWKIIKLHIIVIPCHENEVIM